MSKSKQPVAKPIVAGPLFIADHVALDFLNTAFGLGMEHREFFGEDADVLDWLEQAGIDITPAGMLRRKLRGELLKAALVLRENTRDLVSRRKAGEAADPSVLNEMLACGSGYRELSWPPGQAPALRQRLRIEAVENLLVPIAEAIAELLANADFELIRKCESRDCTLWFLDRTKSHHRRWCSMAACGNRTKVAAFRARKKNRPPG